MAKLFESSRLWGASVAETKPRPRKTPKKPAPVREVASEIPVVQTYVYGDDYSFQKNQTTETASRDIASVNMKGRVIGVRREIGLTEQMAKNIPQEYVINAGARLGLSKGSKLTVYRTLPVVDPYNSNKQHELKVDFATIEVIHVEDDVAVAQMIKMVPATGGQYVGLRGILVGDYVAIR